MQLLGARERGKSEGEADCTARTAEVFDVLPSVLGCIVIRRDSAQTHLCEIRTPEFAEICFAEFPEIGIFPRGILEDPPGSVSRRETAKR